MFTLLLLLFLLLLTDNVIGQYREAGDALPRVAAIDGQIAADIQTSFTVLLAIFFPSVTGMLAFFSKHNLCINVKVVMYFTELIWFCLLIILSFVRRHIS